MNETYLPIIGNLTADPELRFTPSGAAVVNFTIASTPRKFDRQTNEFKDGESLFMRCSAWRDLAENIAETLQRGMRVVAYGRLTSRSYETKEGEKRTVTELEVDSIGPDLLRATATVKKVDRRQGGQFGGQPAAKSDDPWAAPPAQGGWGSQPPKGGAGWGAPEQPEPPFVAPPNVIGW